MSKIIRIDKCRDCTHFDVHSQPTYHGTETTYSCYIKRPIRTIRNPNETPNWCPLEEANDGN